MQPKLKPSRPLRDYVTDLQAWYDGGWLYVADNEQEITLKTACRLQDWDERDLSPQEQDEMDDEIVALGLRPFFCWGQLLEIVENLKEQRPDYSDADLQQAIQYYYEWDAFIELGTST